MLGAADERPAVVEPGRGTVSYADLDRLAEALRQRLRELDVSPGSRIGLYVRRSSDAIAAMLGTLRAGCAYVPVDPRAPVERIADISHRLPRARHVCRRALRGAYRDALKRVGGEPSIQQLGTVGLGKAIEEWAESGNGSSIVERNNDEALGRISHVPVHVWDHRPAERLDDEPHGCRGSRATGVTGCSRRQERCLREPRAIQLRDVAFRHLFEPGLRRARSSSCRTTHVSMRASSSISWSANA